MARQALQALERATGGGVTQTTRVRERWTSVSDKCSPGG